MCFDGKITSFNIRPYFSDNPIMKIMCTPTSMDLV